MLIVDLYLDHSTPDEYLEKGNEIMPLHPTAERFLQQMNALGSPQPHKMSPDLARKTQATAYALFSSQLAPVIVAKVEDRTVSTPERETPVRIYWPLSTLALDSPATAGGSAALDPPLLSDGLATAPDIKGQGDNGDGCDSLREPLPVLVFIHGGGFVLGDLDQYDDICRRLCNGAHAIVISVDYGLAPEWKFPTSVEECYAVTRWAYEHAEALGGDPRRLAIAGDSSGGNFAAAVTLLARDRGENAPQLMYQALLYPAVDLFGESGSKSRLASGYFLEAGDMLWFRECYLPSEEAAKDPLASPLLAESHAGLPPLFIITAEFDPLHDEGVAYADKLSRAKVPVEHVDYPGMIHGFISMTWLFDDAMDAINRTAEKLRLAFELAVG
jgi:acetyl esterase/lipase